MRRFALALSLLAVLAAPARAGSWGREPGGYYGKVSASYLAADELAAPDGQQLDIPEYRRWETVFYLEAGLGRGWTAIVDAPLYRRSEIEGFGDAGGVGDLRLGLQRQIPTRGPWALALRGVVQAPTGDETKGEGVLPTGTGVWEGEAWLSAGRSFARGRWYAFFEAGHQLRGSGLTDSFVHRTQVGVHTSRRLLLAFNVWGVEPYEDRGDETIGSVAGLGDGVRYLAYGPSLILGSGSGWAVQLDAEFAERARNIALGPTVRLGVSFER